MSHVITTYGGGEIFFLVFNGIASLVKRDGGVFIPLVNLGLMIGSIYVVILMLFRNHLIEGIRWLLWVIVATHLLLLPQTRIHIHDPLHNTHRDVDHVPLALGLFASFTSQIGKLMTEQLESTFSLPDYMPYHKTGTVFASSLMKELGKFRITDPVFKGNMERFINGCVVYDVMIGHKYTVADLQNTPNIWELVRTRASPVLGFLYREEGSSGQIVTCKAGAQNLNALWDLELKRATALYGSRIQARTLTESAFLTELMGSARLLMGARGWADSAQNLLRQEMMIQALEEGPESKLNELGGASAYASTKALLQQRSTYAVAGDIAARTLPLFKNVIEALSYALFIFIVVLALLPYGHRVLLTYAGILVWTQLWAPLYAVLNLIMTLYGRAETMAHARDQGLTLLNSHAILNANADMETLAAWLSVSIPFISYGILRQGAAAFVGLAQHLGSAMQSAASGAAHEVVSGNVSLSNIALGTETYQNTSAFQHATSSTFSDAEFKAMSASGIEQTTFADGNQVLSNQALSRLSVQIMGAENTSFASQENLNKALSLAESKSLSAQTAMDAAFQKSTHFLNRVGKDIFASTDFTFTSTSSEAQALQDFKSYVNDIRTTTGLTEAQAFEAALGAHIGVGNMAGKVVGANMTGTFSSSAARQEAIETAQNIANQRGYSMSVENVIAAAKAQAEGMRDSTGRELAKEALASLNHAKSLHEEATLAQHQVETLSKDTSATHSHGITLTKDLTQEILTFIAEQPSNPGPHGISYGPMGYEAARKILENGGREVEAYIHQFQEQHPQYRIQPLTPQDHHPDLERAYEIKSRHIKAIGEDLQIQHNRDVQTLQSKNQRQEGLALPQSLRTLVETQQNQIDATLLARETDLKIKEEALQRKEKEAQDKNIAAAAIQNAGRSLWEGTKDVAELLPKDNENSTPIIIP